MKQPLKRKRLLQWARMLTSGKYKQGTGHLRTEDQDGKPLYCCLGVACELYKRETGQGEWKQAIELEGPDDDHSWHFIATPKADPEGGLLPGEVAKWLGMGWENMEAPLDPQIDPSDDDGNATELNDGGASFEKIARLIRKLV